MFRTQGPRVPAELPDHGSGNVSGRCRPALGGFKRGDPDLPVQELAIWKPRRGGDLRRFLQPALRSRAGWKQGGGLARLGPNGGKDVLVTEGAKGRFCQRERQGQYRDP